MVKISCPFCGTTQKDYWRAGEWKYGEKVNVQRFECGCDNSFNYYESGTKNWTIPKNPKRVPAKN
jgi:hypothetical protein